MLANVIYLKDFENAYIYLKEEITLKEVKEIFGNDLKEILESKESEDNKKLAIAEHLNSLGWTDEEIIEHFLKRKKRKYFLNYVDDDFVGGYFELYEVKE